MVVDKKAQGKKNRQSGVNFERRIRDDLEKQGYIVTKWLNQVDFVKDTLIPAPHKFNFFTKSITPGQGFPDFLAYKMDTKEIIGVESKSGKYLDQEEKKRCKWLLEHKIFETIKVGFKDSKGHINYYEVTEEMLNGKTKKT